MMKIIKSKLVLLNKQNGMAIIEFMMVVMLSMLFVGMLIEIGFYMKSEAIVVGLTKSLAREVQVNGGLTKDKADEIIGRLAKNDINDVEISLYVEEFDTATPTVHKFTQTSGPSEGKVNFRRNFKLYIRGKHKLNLVAVTGNTLNTTVIFAEDGKGENASDFIN